MCLRYDMTAYLYSQRWQEYYGDSPDYTDVDTLVIEKPGSLQRVIMRSVGDCGDHNYNIQ